MTTTSDDHVNAVSPDCAKPQRVGYVLTHYPRVALTFIDSEISQVEQLGVAVEPFAMNSPGPADLAAPGAVARRDRTTYLKANWTRAIAAWLVGLFRHPLAMTGLTLRAVRSAGTDPALMLRRLSHLIQAARLAELCRDRGISHLHAHFGLAPATIAWFATEIARLHGRDATFGFTIHGFHDFIDPMIARLDLKARRASYVVCISDFTRSQLCRTTEPELWERFKVVRCGVDIAGIPFRAPAGSGPQSGLPLKVLGLGRLSPEKGFALLILAIRQLREEGIDVELVLVGDGPLRGSLEALAREHGLAGAVRFTGELAPPEVLAELRDADIFCMASFSEGLPVSIMEAMAAGVPVVTTWISGIPELAVEGVTALTVPPARPDALADAIRRLACDPPLRVRLAEGARRRVELMHDAKTNARQMAAIFRKSAP